MFGSKSKKDTNKRKNTKIDSLVGQQTVIEGDVKYSGGLHIDGKVIGNVIANKDDKSMLSVSEQGTIEGDVHVSNIMLNGTVLGNVYAYERVELAPNARVTGNVYYNLIEMAMGSEVNGNLVHQVDTQTSPAESSADSSDNAKPSQVILDQVTQK